MELFTIRRSDGFGRAPCIRLLNNSISSYKGKSSGAGAKPEQPVCEQAVAFSLGGLQELELLTLFAKHFHIQVAVGFDPILVDFDRQRPNEPQAALLIRKDADDMGAALDLLIESRGDQSRDILFLLAISTVT